MCTAASSEPDQAKARSQELAQDVLGRLCLLHFTEETRSLEKVVALSQPSNQLQIHESVSDLFDS